jgi:hypothetical protein
LRLGVIYVTDCMWRYVFTYMTSTACCKAISILRR